jgi:hypothetical protein
MKKIAVGFLAMLGAASTLSSTGCWYDRPNPWNTSADVEDLQDRKERDWLLELRPRYDYPQNDGMRFALAELEGWRGTVLANADVSTLTRMRDQSVQKVAGLETRAYSMAPINEDSKVQIYELLWQVRVEKIRLGMIEERLGSVSR